eukprot:6344503-Prymnesium_polylepis.1
MARHHVRYRRRDRVPRQQARDTLGDVGGEQLADSIRVVGVRWLFVGAESRHERLVVRAPIPSALVRSCQFHHACRHVGAPHAVAILGLPSPIRPDVAVHVAHVCPPARRERQYRAHAGQVDKHIVVRLQQVGERRVMRGCPVEGQRLQWQR